ncbi:hypothetical protein ACLOJK_004507 [Asimina triloba]
MMANDDPIKLPPAFDPRAPASPFHSPLSNPSAGQHPNHASTTGQQHPAPFAARAISMAAPRNFDDPCPHFLQQIYNGQHRSPWQSVPNSNCSPAASDPASTVWTTSSSPDRTKQPHHAHAPSRASAIPSLRPPQQHASLDPITATTSSPCSLTAQSSTDRRPHTASSRSSSKPTAMI